MQKIPYKIKKISGRIHYILLFDICPIVIKVTRDVPLLYSASTKAKASRVKILMRSLYDARGLKIKKNGVLFRKYVFLMKCFETFYVDVKP